MNTKLLIKGEALICPFMKLFDEYSKTNGNAATAATADEPLQEDKHAGFSLSNNESS